MEALALVLAAAAAGCNALSSVLQRRANRSEPEEASFGISLLVSIVRQPVWLFGLLAMIASFLLQATALDLGTLASVEPMLALELPVTLLLAAWLLSVSLSRRDWVLALTMAAGLGVFIAALSPSGGDAGQVSHLAVGGAAVLTVLAIAALLVFGTVGPRRARAAAYGAAAGAGFGLTASMMKVAVTALADGGVITLLQTWETYATIAAGLASVVMVQAALHAGTLVAAQPGFTLMDPLVSVIWGAAVLGEHVRTGPTLVLAAVGAGSVVVAVVLLARSRALVDHNTPQRTS